MPQRWQMPKAALCAAYREGARQLARALEAWVLQSNWSEGLNLPGPQGFGASTVIEPGGRPVMALPLDGPAMAVVSLA